MASAEATTLRAVIGRNVRAWRLQEGLTADQFARELVRIGANWTGAKVLNLEAGERELLLDELLLLVMVTGLSPAELLAGDDEQVVIRGADPVGGGASMPLGLARDVLTVEPTALDRDVEPTALDRLRTYGEWQRTQRARRAARSPEKRASECAQLDAERKAARKFDVEPYDIALAALRLWGRCLTDERDTRVAAATEPGASPRTIQALRGHITRTLLAELAPTIEEQNR